MAAYLALCASLGCQTDDEPSGPSKAHAAAIRDNMSSALDAFRTLGSGRDPMAVGGFCSESPAFPCYENGALRYESAADLRAALKGLGPARQATPSAPSAAPTALKPPSLKGTRPRSHWSRPPARADTPPTIWADSSATARPPTPDGPARPGSP